MGQASCFLSVCRGHTNHTGQRIELVVIVDVSAQMLECAAPQQRCSITQELGAHQQQNCSLPDQIKVAPCECKQAETLDRYAPAGPSQ